MRVRSCSYRTKWKSAGRPSPHRFVTTQNMNENKLNSCWKIEKHYALPFGSFVHLFDIDVCDMRLPYRRQMTAGKVQKLQIFTVDDISSLLGFFPRISQQFICFRMFSWFAATLLFAICSSLPCCSLFSISYSAFAFFTLFFFFFVLLISTTF